MQPRSLTNIDQFDEERFFISTFECFFSFLQQFLINKKAFKKKLNTQLLNLKRSIEHSLITENSYKKEEEYKKIKDKYEKQSKKMQNFFYNNSKDIKKYLTMLRAFIKENDNLAKKFLNKVNKKLRKNDYNKVEKDIFMSIRIPFKENEKNSEVSICQTNIQIEQVLKSIKNFFNEKTKKFFNEKTKYLKDQNNISDKLKLYKKNYQSSRSKDNNSKFKNNNTRISKSYDFLKKTKIQVLGDNNIKKYPFITSKQIHKLNKNNVKSKLIVKKEQNKQSYNIIKDYISNQFKNVLQKTDKKTEKLISKINDLDKQVKDLQTKISYFDSFYFGFYSLENN